MAISQAERSFHLKVAAEVLEVLRSIDNPAIPRADLLCQTVRSGREPHPRVVREVHQALIEALAAKAKEPPSTLKKISGVFLRRAEPKAPSLEEVVPRFEQAFVRHD